MGAAPSFVDVGDWWDEGVFVDHRFVCTTDVDFMENSLMTNARGVRFRDVRRALHSDEVEARCA